MLSLDAFGELPFAPDARRGACYPGGAPATNAERPTDAIALQVQMRTDARVRRADACEAARA